MVNLNYVKGPGRRHVCRFASKGFFNNVKSQRTTRVTRSNDREMREQNMPKNESLNNQQII
jgi:hypothetical protein